MKLKSLVAAIALVSSSAMASDYNVQADVDYIDYDGGDAFVLSGTYYFDQVNTANTALKESAFMGRNNNVGASYADFDGDINALSIFGEFYGDNDFYAQLSFTDIEVGNNSDSVIGAEVGYFFEKNWLVAIGTTSSDADDPIYLRTKYVNSLGGGQFLNFEATIDDEDYWSIGGDYFWTPETSLGLEIDEIDETDATLKFQHFFSGNVALKVTHAFGDFDQTMVGLTARF